MQILRDAGVIAVLQDPQTLMVLETVSNIHGQTLNPWNTKLGALLAQHGSPMGVGSDIGGSIRAPAAFNGVYGFKPSGYRIPTVGLVAPMIGAESITGVVGPMGNAVEDLELFCQTVLDAKPWLKEPLLAMPWKSQLAAMRDEKLTIGVMLWDEVVMPHPYIIRVLREVAEKLKHAGHQVLDFKPYDHKRAWDEILLPLYFTDGGHEVKAALGEGGEPMLPGAKRILDDPLVKERSVGEVWKLNYARDVYRCEYLQRWAETAKASGSGKPMDVLICPVSPAQGTPHDVKPWWGYTAQWNLLDYPGGAITVGKVLEGDAYPEGYRSVNELDRENMELYDDGLYLGMPVAVQVVASQMAPCGCKGQE